jgi:hypothetical protein
VPSAAGVKAAAVNPAASQFVRFNSRLYSRARMHRVNSPLSLQRVELSRLLSDLHPAAETLTTPEADGSIYRATPTSG